MDELVAGVIEYMNEQTAKEEGEEEDPAMTSEATPPLHPSLVEVVGACTLWGNRRDPSCSSNRPKMSRSSHKSSIFLNVMNVSFF